MVALPVIAFVLAAAPQSSPDRLRMLMLVGGTPVGVVRAERAEGTWTYVSTHLYRSGSAERRASLELDASGRTHNGRVPETLWLARLRAVGCVDAVEELELVPERVCVRQRHADGSETAIEGTIGDAAFRARYGAQGTLRELEVNEMTFRSSDDPLPETADPFAAGFALVGQATRGPWRLALTGGDASLSEAMSAAKQLDDAPDGREPFATTDCLTASRALVKSRSGLSLVVGVVTEDGRAWPHAWVEDAATHRAVDPTLAPNDARLAQRRYLAFPKDAGRLYLALLAGAVRISRVPAGANR